MSDFTPVEPTPYKVHWLRQNEGTSQVFVFAGVSVPSGAASGILSAEEKQYFDKHAIEVKYVEQRIYPDDTLATVKLKIAIALGDSVTIDELLLFGSKEVTLNPLHVFAQLTQQGKTLLATATLRNFLANVQFASDTERDAFLQQLPAQQTISLETLRALPWPKRVMRINVPLGSRSTFPSLICNPFVALLEPSDTGLDRQQELDLTNRYKKLWTTNNNRVLLNTGDLAYNTVYCCCAEDLLQAVGEGGADSEVFLQRYFPFLAYQDVTSLDTLKAAQSQLLEKKEQQVEETQRTFQTVDLFYRLSTSGTEEQALPLVAQGIRSIQFLLQPQFNTLLPLDTLFKQLHATANRPFIKFAPGANQENLYRLYTAGQLAVDGRKIPALDKPVLYRLSKTGGAAADRNKGTLSFVVTDRDVTCELNAQGVLRCSASFDLPQTTASVGALLQTICNTILSDICSALLLPEGDIALFAGLQQDNVQLLNLKLETRLDSLPHNLSTKTFRDCVSTVFLPQRRDPSAPDAVQWLARFRRVDNFSVTNAQEQFVIESIQAKLQPREMVEGLMDRFQLTEDQASKTYRTIMEDLEVVEYEPGQKRLQTNPGFLCLLESNRSTRSTSFVVSGINDAGYLDLLPIYVQSLFRMWLSATSGKYVSAQELTQLRQLCGLPSAATAATEAQGEPEEAQEAENDIDLAKLQPVQRQTMDESALLFEEEEDSDQPSVVESGEEEKAPPEEEFSQGFGGAAKKIRFQQADDSDPESSEEELSEPEAAEEEVEEDELNKAKPLTARSVEGMKISNPYYFQRRIEEYDNVLISKQSDRGKSNTYSRSCSSSTRKQPVVLTDEELANIRAQNPGFIRKEDVLRYGSDVNNQHNYICPRFWCLKYNTVIDPKDLVKDAATGDLVHRPSNPDTPSCGRVMAQNATEVRDPYYIYEFHPEGKRYPGLMKPTLPHPAKPGLCYPCCFTKHEGESKTRKDINDSCRNAMAGEGATTTVQPVAAHSQEVDYIKGPEKFPLDPMRWGYLQPSLQLMLRDMSTGTCTSTRLSKLKGACLLRHGVQITPTQSFVACLADALSFAEPNTPPLSLQDVKQRLADTVTLDLFVGLQNGNLVTDFFDPDAPTPDLAHYKRDSKLGRSMSRKSSEAQEFFFRKAVVALERFRSFLTSDNSVEITPFHLWDLVCGKHAQLFPQGLNLVILDLPMDDATAKVQLMCPSNHYAKEMYNPTKPCLLLVRQEDYYEPLYLYKLQDKEVYVTKFFLESDRQLAEPVRAILKQLVKPLLDGTCRPKAAPHMVQAKQAPTLYELTDMLNDIGYRVHKYLLNFAGKVIAVQTSKQQTRGLVPCYPTALAEWETGDVPVVFLDDKEAEDMRLSYKKTVRFLATLYKRSGRKIPCRPLLAAMEDRLIVGVLTETDQMVPLSKTQNPLDVPAKYKLPLLQNSSWRNDQGKPSDITVETSVEQDKDRVSFMRRLTAETKLYNLYRQTMRTLLNKPEMQAARSFLQSLAAPPSAAQKPMTYSTKLERATQKLAEVGEQAVQFSGAEDQYLTSDLGFDLGLCKPPKGKRNATCDADQWYCALSDNGNCQLILPKYNLLNGELNEPRYRGRLADELIRYSRINQYFFQPQMVLALAKTEYNLREDEMLLMQSLMTPAYLDSLQLASSSKQHIRQNAYDEVQPQQSHGTPRLPPTAEEVALEEEKEREEDTGSDTSSAPEVVRPRLPQLQSLRCKISAHRVLTMADFWKNAFNDFCGGVTYGKTFPCNYLFALELLRQAGKQGVTTVTQLKEELYRGYAPLLPTYQNKLFQLLMTEGKRDIGEQLLAGRITMQDAIQLDSYFLSPLDLWVLAQTFQLPLILLAQGPVAFSKRQLPCFVAYAGAEAQTDFYFVVIPMRNDKVPSYTFVVEWPEKWLQPKGPETAKYAPLKPHTEAELHELVGTQPLLLDYTQKVVGKGVQAIEMALANAQTLREFLDGYHTPKRQAIVLEEDIEPEEVAPEEEETTGPEPKRSKTEEIPPTPTPQLPPPQGDVAKKNNARIVLEQDDASSSDEER